MIGNICWYSVTSDSTGMNLAACSFDSIYISTSSGSSWSRTTAPANKWTDVVTSSTGSILVAVDYGGGIWISDSAPVHEENASSVGRPPSSRPSATPSSSPPTGLSSVHEKSAVYQCGLNCTPWDDMYVHFPDQGAEWTWSVANARAGAATYEYLQLKKVFTSANSYTGTLHASCDDYCYTYFSDQFVAYQTSWSSRVPVDINIVAGSSTVTLVAWSTDGPAGLIASIYSPSSTVVVHTDTSWLWSQLSSSAFGALGPPSEQTPEPSQGPKHCPEGYILHETFNKCYKSYNERSSWSNAQTICHDNGGQLVTIRSSEENYFVYSIASKATSSWIGLSDYNHESTWKWTLMSSDGISTEIDATYSNFYPGEPNGGSNENCATIVEWSPYWNDLDCASGWPMFVCESPPYSSSQEPSSIPSATPSTIPSATPSSRPSATPSSRPSPHPTTTLPTSQPSTSIPTTAHPIHEPTTPTPTRESDATLSLPSHRPSSSRPMYEPTKDSTTLSPSFKSRSCRPTRNPTRQPRKRYVYRTHSPTYTPTATSVPTTKLDRTYTPTNIPDNRSLAPTNIPQAITRSPTRVVTRQSRSRNPTRQQRKRYAYRTHSPSKPTKQ